MDARRHLDVETQRRPSDRAIARSTPALLGLSSVVALLAARLVRDGCPPVRTAVWYATLAPILAGAHSQRRAPRAPPAVVAHHEI